MARRPRRSDDGGEKRQRRRRRLYLLTNDGDQGTSIYKLNEYDFDSDDAYSEDNGSTSSDSENSEDSRSFFSDYSYDSFFTSSSDSESSASTSSSSDKMDHFNSEYDVDSRARRLRHRRLVVRLARQQGLTEFVAAGTKIFGLNRYPSCHAADVSFVFDAATRLVSAAPPFQSPKSSPTFWTAGGTIYALNLNNHKSHDRCLFERLGPDPRSLYNSLRWEALPQPPSPLNRDRYLELECHAVHPDGATVFLSFRNGHTYSFDGKRREWAHHGRWSLPFDGEAYHVRELDAWVGLCSRHKGHLAACQVVKGDRRGGAAEPESKCGKDVLFRHRWKRHINANLVYKGNAKFCLLETVSRGHIDDNMTLLRLVTFRVRYSFDGELCVEDRRSRVYELPSISSWEKPRAFWV